MPGDVSTWDGPCAVCIMREFASRAAFVLCAFATCASHAWKFDPVATATGDPALEAPPVPLALDASDGFPYDDLDPGDLPTTSPLDRDEEDEEEVKDTTPALTLLNTRTRSTLRNPFHPPGPGAYGAYAVLCVSAVVFAVGVMANVAIMCIVCHNYYMRSISNSLLANMAMWDFVIVFFCLPLVVFHQLTGTWLLGEFSCRIVPYLEVVCLGVTTFTLCALCIDRFRAATNVQLYYEMMESCASTSAKLAVIWAGALLLATPELLIRQLETGQDEDGGEGPAPSPARQRCVVRISTSLPDAVYVLGLTYEGARLWWCFGCYFCLPTLFTIGCSLATARRIQQAERRIPGGSAGSAATGGSRKQLRQESQMNCAVVALAILYGICVVPENICNIVSAYMAAGVSRHLLDLLQLLSQMLLFCKSAAAPVLLLCLCRPFRHTFLQCCCCCCSACVPVKGANATGDQQEGTNELELSPFSTETRDLSPFTHIGTHC